MSTQDFLEDLRRRDTRLLADGGRLRLSVPKGGMTPELKERMAQRKTDIPQLLAAQEAAGDGPSPSKAGGPRS